MSETVGLVVSGAGARGAYEAGAIASLLPHLPRSEHPPILVGTSAGALNVVALAAFAGDGYKAATHRIVSLWSTVGLDDVFGPVGTLVGTGLRYLGQAAGLDVTLPSLLDTERMRDLLTSLICWEDLHANIRSGAIGAVAVTATSVATRGTVVFVEKHPSVPLPDYDEQRNITYVETELSVEHVLASAAVPVLFRPVRVTEPAAWAGWYVDGGLQLNTPLKPALALGADTLGVVATQPRHWIEQPAADLAPGDDEPPDVFGAAALVLRAVLSDRMIEDLHQLEVRNDRLMRIRAAGVDSADVTSDREIEVRFAGPSLEQAYDLGRLAYDIYSEKGAGVGGLRHPWLSVLGRLVGGTREDHGDLLSFLLFDPDFTSAAAELGLAALHRLASREQAPRTSS